MLRQPRGGLPGVPEDAKLLANVPIYGARGAGRGFWKKLRQVFIDAGFVECKYEKALLLPKRRRRAADLSGNSRGRRDSRSGPSSRTRLEEGGSFTHLRHN